jgi:hypothetical protein
MNNPNKVSQHRLARVTLVALTVGLMLAGTSIWGRFGALANHPVLVEGERDFDGDGRIGLAEDTDGDDRIFGTITAALAAANGAANQNGRVTVVTSGRFHEQVMITNANGNTTLEAAPGVEANIDAVATGTRALEFPGSTNAIRQGQPGVVVTSPANRYVTLRNLVIRNWTEGIQTLGNSRVNIDNCRLESNVNYGIHVLDNGRVSIVNCQVSATGFRVGATGDFPSAANQPNPGMGIAFRGTSIGNVAATTVTGSFSAGIANLTGNSSAVGILQVNALDNRPNFVGVKPPQGTVPSADHPFSLN